MPTNPIANQEMAFAHHILSGTINDRLATEAIARRRLNPDRDQVLARLWQLANLSPEATRGSITAQIKALTMIIAMEGLIPNRRQAATKNQTPESPVNADIYRAEWLREQQDQPASTAEAPPEPPNPLQEQSSHEASSAPFAIPAGEKRTQEPPRNVAPPPNTNGNLSNPMYSGKLNRVPDAEGATSDAVLNTAIPRGQPLSLRLGLSGRRR